MVLKSDENLEARNYFEMVIEVSTLSSFLKWGIILVVEGVNAGIGE